MQKTWLVLVLLVFGSMFVNAEELPNQVERTENKQKEWMENFLNDQLIELSAFKTDYSNNKFVFVRSKGRLQKETLVETVSGQRMKYSSPIFVLFYGFDQCEVMDGHGRMTFEISKVMENSVIFHYRSSFSLNSFGKNLTTIDEGEVEIKLRRPDN